MSPVMKKVNPNTGKTIKFDIELEVSLEKPDLTSS